MGKTSRDNVGVTCDQAVEYINTVWSQSLHVYPGGFKDPVLARTAAAFCIPDITVIKSARLYDHLSVLSAELFAIVLALEWTIDFNPLSTVFFSSQFHPLV